MIVRPGDRPFERRLTAADTVLGCITRYEPRTCRSQKKVVARQDPDCQRLGKGSQPLGPVSVGLSIDEVIISPFLSWVPVKLA